MEIERAHLQKLFDGKIRYLVPNYQRIYVWDEEDQWDPLWLDVQGLAEALLEDARTRTQPTGIDENAVDSHFMGAVVLKGSGITPDLATQFRVVDGQQRLTTLQLLLTAAEREIRPLHATYADRLLDLISTPERSLNSPSLAPEFDQFKISFQRHRRGHDYESFGPVLHAALNGADIESIDGPLADCYRYFRKKSRRWLQSRQYDSLAAAALGATLLSKIFVVGLYLDPHEKEHIIFETLNARGEPLTEWDKAKNYLLYLADESPNLDPALVYENFLERFDDQWWRQEVGRGAQARPRTDVYLDYWLESKIEAPVSARRVFRQFQSYLSSQLPLTSAVLGELVRDAEYFRKWERGTWKDSRESLYHFRRRQMGLGVIWPVLIRLNKVIAGQSERDRCFGTLESYFVRRLIVGRQARSYVQVVMDLLNVLPGVAEAGADANGVLHDKLGTYSWGGALWPSDSELESAVSGRWMPGYVRRIALAAIESHLIHPDAGSQTPVKSLSQLHIEHIMPTGWGAENWPLPDSEDDAAARSDRDTLIQSLGNLTLLNKRLNQTISNSAWAVKSKKVKDSDNLFLNKRLLEDAGDVWTEGGIQLRGKWMYGLLKEIWPRG